MLSTTSHPRMQGMRRTQSLRRMQSLRRSHTQPLLHLIGGLRLAVSVTLAVLLALILFAPVGAAPGASGAVGGLWQTVAEPPLAGQRITALLPDSPNGMWVGTEERGLAHWDGSRWRILSSIDGLPDNRVIALFADQSARLWVSTGTGLGYLSLGSGIFHRVPVERLPSLPVLAIGQSPDGGILLGNPSGLAVWQDDGTLALVPQLAGKRVHVVHTAHDGTTWLATSAGLWRNTGHGWQLDERVSGAVRAFTDRPDGALFLAGETGAWEFRDRQWTLLQPGASRQFTAASAHGGSLWLGGPTALTAGQDEVWHTYDPRFLPSPAITALAWSGDSRLWVGTSAGLSIHQPDDQAPRVTIASINGVPAVAPVQLETDSITSIRLTAEDASPTGEFRFFLQLDGVDDAPRLLTPVEAANPQGISVYLGRRLPAGTHTLRAWAEDDAFNRSTEASLEIDVPSLTHLPGGLTVPEETTQGGAASLAVLITAGAAARAARYARRRHLARIAEAAAARVRAASDRSGELYAAPVWLREDYVQDALGALPAQNVLILGDEGMGKTETLAAIAERLERKEKGPQRLAPALVDLAAIGEADFFRSLAAAAARALYLLGAGERPRLNWNGDVSNSYSEQEFSADLGVLLAWLRPQRTERLVLLFLIDNADRIDQYQAALRDAFCRLVMASSPSAPGAASPVRLVLAAPHAPRVIDGRRNLFHEVVLAPIGQASAVQLLREGARGIVQWESEAEHLAVERAGGNPAHLLALGRKAALAALAGRRLTVLPADVP